MKYFLIAGEASGDLHASNLIAALREKDAHAVFVGMGGDKMAGQGCRLVQDYRQMAFMGVVAVLSNLHKVYRNFQIAKHFLLDERPDILVLVDYPSFNLRMAAFCRKHLPKTRIVYYIPPKVWAWKTWRIHKIARLSDEILGIFPFEPAFYARYGYSCRYVGNPTADSIRAWQSQQKRTDLDDEKQPVIALLPGSRRSEISHCLPTMLAAAREVVRQQPQVKVVVTAAPGVEDSFYEPMLDGATLTHDTYLLLSKARVAVVNSGTATLETALLGCPETAVYHIAASRFFGKKVVDWFKHHLFKDGYFTLVNILTKRETIKELIAEQFTQEKIATELSRLLSDEPYRMQMQEQFAALRTLLGDQPAAQTAAQTILE